jgi:hypothetical protein
MNQSLAANQPSGLFGNKRDEGMPFLARARAAMQSFLKKLHLPREEADCTEAAGKVIYLRKIIPRFGVLNLSGALPKSEVIVVVYECPRGGRIFPRVQVTEIA